MKSWKRITLLILALGAFFVIAPALVFYAMGYRYDFKNNAFRQIGMVIVESQPENANIFIDDKYVSQTPERIKNLLPGEYSVKITKDKYNPWEKKMSVESKKVTWASNIRLFYENPEINILSEAQFENFSISPDYEKIVSFSKEGNNFGLWLFDLKENTTKNILDKDSEIVSENLDNSELINFTDFKWSPDSKKIILSVQKKEPEKNVTYIILDLPPENKITSLNDSYDLNVQDVKWKNSNEIYLLDKSKNIHQLSLNFQTEPKTLSDNVLNFDINSNEEIIYLKDEKDNIKLLTENANSQEDLILNLSEDESYIMKAGYNDNIALLFKNKKRLYLINTKTKKPLVIGENIENFKWSEEKSRLIYFNKNEIWFYVLKEEEEQNNLAYRYNEGNFLTRYSTEIKNVDWYPTEEHLAIIFDNMIKITELDGRDRRNCYELNQEINKLNYKIEFNKKGRKIYFIDQKTKNITEIEITES